MPQPTIAVVDYHKGNLMSVARGLARAGALPLVTDDPAAIARADGIVLPGVGAFHDAAVFMHEAGQDAAVVDAVAAGTPFLGICLGLQLLFERGDEGVPPEREALPAADAYGKGLATGAVFEAEGRRWTRGLGILPGSCTLLPSRRLKVPHVGWNQVHLTPAGRSCPVLAGFPEGANVYFTHSFALDGDVAPEDVAAHTHYACTFASVVWHGNIFGCQFHPEKSSARGHEIIENFVRVAARRKEGAA